VTSHKSFWCLKYSCIVFTNFSHSLNWLAYTCLEYNCVQDAMTYSIHLVLHSSELIAIHCRNLLNKDDYCDLLNVVWTSKWISGKKYLATNRKFQTNIKYCGLDKYIKSFLFLKVQIVAFWALKHNKKIIILISYWMPEIMKLYCIDTIKYRIELWKTVNHVNWVKAYLNSKLIIKVLGDCFCLLFLEEFFSVFSLIPLLNSDI